MYPTEFDMTTINYNMRIDKDLKEKAFSVFESYGLTPSQAIKLFLNQVADTNQVPLSFDYQSKLNELDKHTNALLEELATTKSNN